MSYEAMLAQYQNSQNSGTQTTFNSEENLKNYFTTWIPDDVKSKQKTIRILPTGDKSSPFKQVKGHSIQVNGKWTKLLCPKDTENKPCPFCEANQVLRSTEGKTETEIKEDKEIAKKYSQRDMYVLKVIDREKEAEGPKFFRFNKDYTNQGIFDKIMALVILMGQDVDITSAEHGFDLILDIKRDQNNTPVVNAIMAKPGNATPLHTNVELAQSWLADTRTWKDVYKTKEYDYLEIILNGEIPVFNKETNKYVAKSSADKASKAEEENSDIKSLTNDLKNNDLSGPSEMISSQTFNASSEDEGDDVPF